VRHAARMSLSGPSTVARWTKSCRGAARVGVGRSGAACSAGFRGAKRSAAGIGASQSPGGVSDQSPRGSRRVRLDAKHASAVRHRRRPTKAVGCISGFEDFRNNITVQIRQLGTHESTTKRKADDREIRRRATPQVRLHTFAHSRRSAHTRIRRRVIPRMPRGAKPPRMQGSRVEEETAAPSEAAEGDQSPLLRDQIRSCDSPSPCTRRA
jgi:hypothetical protein